MADVTEIYACVSGQKLRDGRLSMSDDIETKEEAEKDAKRRCKIDNSIEKVAYYRIKDDGSFRLFCTYTNPHVSQKAPPKKPEMRERVRPAVKKKPPPPKKTLGQKILAMLKLGK